MAQQKFVNIFDGGLNTDSDPKSIENNQYPSAVNIDVTGSGSFRTAKPLQGSTYLDSLPQAFSNMILLGAFDSTYLINDIETPCATLFGIWDTTFQIWACPIDGDTSPIQVYEKTGQDIDDYESVDAKIYAENGVNYLYFVDGVNAPGKIRCVLPRPGGGLYSDTEISLLKRAPLGLKITDFTVEEGGDLLCGSYSTCIRYYNNETNKVSAWSIPTLPIKLHLDASDHDAGFHTSGRGISSAKKIVFDIAFNNSAEKELYTHYQIGVIENISTDTPAQIMSVLPPVELPDAVTDEYEYKSNFKVNTTTIDDVVIEPAPIKTAKTLEIKDNRLFLGNVTYKNLEYDNGLPEIGQTSLPQFFDTTTVCTVAPTVTEGDNWYTDDTYASKFVGYFRDEVYRFAVSYYDENYNFSSPVPLDMSIVTNNQISGDSTDMKFPTRNQYELINTNNNPVALGVRLARFTNHPSWACGFVVLRAKRKENILGQSPIIPATLVKPTLAVYEFPNRPVVATRQSAGVYDHDVVEYLDAQPAENPNGIIVPKNMLRSVPTDIVRFGLTEHGGIWTDTVRYSYDSLSNRWIFFHPGSMFQSQTGTFLDPYTLKNGDKLKTIDVIRQRRSYRTYGETDLTGVMQGEYIETEVDVNFFSTLGADYYSLGSGSTGWTPSTLQITDHVFVDNNERTAIFDSGERIEDYPSVMETVVPDGTVPTALRKSYLQIKGDHSDVVTYSYAFPQSTPFGTIPAGTVSINGSKLNFNWSGYNPNSSKYGNAFALTGGSGTPEHQFVEIANIEKGLTDDRYGASDAYHEYIYTGASYEFSDSQKASLRAGTNITTQTVTGLVVYGGDCYISYVNYKVTDSHFGVSNDKQTSGGQTFTADQVAERWKHGFYAIRGPLVLEASRPVPYKAMSQVISCYIESKYNLDVQVRAGVHQTGAAYTGSNTPFNISSAASEARIPYNYVIQPELSFENTYKIWIPRLESQIVRDKYRSRIVFSNQKIYQSDVEGFDLFNALSYYDLTESHGAITKLINSNDKLFTVQESAVLYVPVNASTLETADGASIKVRSDVVIDTPQYVSNIYGAQNPRSVCNAAGSIFFVDQIRGKIVAIAGGSAPAFVSDIGMKRHFENSLNPDQYTDLYVDNKRNKLYVGYGAGVNRKDRYIFDLTSGKWVCQLDTNPDDDPFMFIAAANVADKFIVFGFVEGFEDSLISYAAWDTSSTNTHFGVALQPQITFYVNPSPGQPKIFNNLIVDSSDNLLSATCRTYRDSDFGNQATTALDLTLDHRYESNYKIAILRDTLNGNEERLRGSFLEVNLQWPSTAISTDTKLASVTTKYQESKARI